MTTLETLPAEIRLNILSFLRLKDLGSLIHASPVLFQQFLSSKKSVLVNSIQVTLRGAALDALVAHRCGTAKFAESRCHLTVMDTLKNYKEKLNQKSYDLLDEDDITVEEAVEMAAFQVKIVQPLAESYSARALDSLAKESGKCIHELESLSAIEEIRMWRAMYRLQVACMLFGNTTNSNANSDWLQEHFSTEFRFKEYIALFEPWELEAILCVYGFALDHFTKFFRSHNYPEVEDVTGGIGSCAIHALSAPSFGLKMVHQVALTTTDRNELLEIITKYSDRHVGLFINNCFTPMTQIILRQSESSARHQLEKDRVATPFRGDGDGYHCRGFDQLVFYPPLAWTMVWGSTYNNVFGLLIPERLRDCGLVFWEAGRVESVGGEPLVKGMWCKGCAEFNDPRDWPWEQFVVNDDYDSFYSDGTPVAA